MTDKVTREEGSISIHTENIFPIIKKWLYSDKDIFLRELVSNAVDAIHKLKNVNLVEGLQLEDEYKVNIHLDKDAGTLTVSDNGIGMTADEVRKYINQVAFSSAEDFIEKFKDLEDKNQIIGTSDLGFIPASWLLKKLKSGLFHTRKMPMLFTGSVKGQQATVLMSVIKKNAALKLSCT